MVLLVINIIMVFLFQLFSSKSWQFGLYILLAFIDYAIVGMVVLFNEENFNRHFAFKFLQYSKYATWLLLAYSLQSLFIKSIWQMETLFSWIGIAISVVTGLLLSFGYECIPNEKKTARDL